MTSDQLNFREASIADAQGISANEQSSHITPWSLGLIKDSINGSHLVWVIEQQQQNIGHLFVLPVLGQWELLNLVINPQSQGRGFGFQALSFLLQQAKSEQISSIFLEVRRSNQAARNLYSKLGFEEVGVRKKYYKLADGREDAIIMQVAV